MQKTNNNACISGVITEKFCYSHQIYGEKFYTSTVDVERKSGVIDSVPIMVSERLADVGSVLDGDGAVTDKWVGERVYIYGHFRSFNKHDGNRNHLILHLFAREFFCIDDIGHDDNSIELDGFICKEPIYRKTPYGREICDILLAVNRPYGKSDYIPCICWGRNSRFASGLEAGTRLKVQGRIQSREYFKEISEGYSERRTAYEVSISQMEVVESEECKDQVADAE